MWLSCSRKAAPNLHENMGLDCVHFMWTQKRQNVKITSGFIYLFILCFESVRCDALAQRRHTSLAGGRLAPGWPGWTAEKRPGCVAPRRGGRVLRTGLVWGKKEGVENAGGGWEKGRRKRRREGGKCQSGTLHCLRTIRAQDRSVSRAISQSALIIPPPPPSPSPPHSIG